MEKELYDVAIIGGGPNGLICGAYLAKAGLKVVILEARHETGGGCDTLEFAGHKYNLHAIYHMMAEIMPPFTDFNLSQRGLRYIFPEVQTAYINKDGKPLVLYRDVQKTADFIATRFSKADGERYARFQSDAKEYFERILLPGTYVQAVPALDQVVALNNAKGDIGKRFNEIAEFTPSEILDHYGFSDPLKACLLNLFTMWGMSNYDGIGFLFPLYAHRMTNAAISVGGSHRVSSALHKAFIEAGGKVMDEAKVVKVTMSGGRVDGVLLADGVEVKAQVVASTVDPHQNFLKFFSPDELPPDLVESTRKWEWEKQVFFGAHISMKEAPRYIGSDAVPDANRALITFMGIGNTEEILDHAQSIEEGRIPEKPLGHTTVASLFDPIQAPPGFHTGRWESLVPFDADWDAIKDDYARQCLATWKEYAPNLEPIHTHVYPPTYIEKKLINMVRGSIKQGSYKILQMGFFRPNDQCSQCWTPIQGFYVCGASVYPGGLVIGGPGYVGANVIADDFGVKKPWNEPECVTRAKEDGFIPTN